MTRRHLAAVAVLGALLGMWISPGRAYSDEPVDRWPVCKYEDGSGQKRCVWDARHSGNGTGDSFKMVNGGTDAARITYISHKRAHRLAYGGK